MNEKIKEGEWLEIGKNLFPKDSVISKVFNDRKAEVVYLTDIDKPIYEIVILEDNVWQFEKSGTCGSYAEKSERHKKFIKILKKGRF